MKDGRDAREPYRVRVGDVWYWVDPTRPADTIEPGDFAIIYPARGDAALAVLQSPFNRDQASSVTFSTLEGERFVVPSGEIAALHLAAVDDQQT